MAPAVPTTEGYWVEVLAIAGSAAEAMLPGLLAHARDESVAAQTAVSAPVWDTKVDDLNRWRTTNDHSQPINAWHISWYDNGTIRIVPLALKQELRTLTEGYRYSGRAAELVEHAEKFPSGTDLRAIAQWCKPSDRLFLAGLFAEEAPPTLTPEDLPAVVGQLLAQLQRDVPTLQQAAIVDPTWGFAGAWNGALATAFLPPATTRVGHQVQVLLHETAHAICSHHSLGDVDIDTHIQEEREAWEKALELAHQYRVGRYLTRPTVERLIANQETIIRRLLWTVGKIAGTDRAAATTTLLIRWMREDGYFPNRGNDFLTRLEQHPEYYALRDRGPLFPSAWPRRTSLRVPRFQLTTHYTEGTLLAEVLRHVIEGTFPQVDLSCVTHNEPGWVDSAYFLDGQNYLGGGYAEIIGLVHQQARTQKNVFALDWMWFSPSRKANDQPCVYFVEVVDRQTALGPGFIFVPGPDPKSVGQRALLSYITSLGRCNSFFRRQIPFSSWAECRTFAQQLQQRPWDDKVVALGLTGKS